MYIKIFQATIKQWMPFNASFTESNGMPFGACVMIYWSNGNVAAFTNVSAVHYHPADNSMGIASDRFKTARAFKNFDKDNVVKIERVTIMGCDRFFDCFERVDCFQVEKLEEA